MNADNYSCLFDIIKDKKVKLMLDMSRENISDSDCQDIKNTFSNIDISDFFALCHKHELDGVVGACAVSLGLELTEEWKQELSKQRTHLNFLKQKAIDICTVMQENGIPMVILKNGGIMLDIIDDATKCPMEDIDSLVKKEHFYRAHEILINNGFTFKFRSEYEKEKLDEAYRNGSTEYYITTPTGEKMWFELAWRAVAGRWIRLDLEPDTDGFIDDSYCANGTAARVLSAEDNLLQVCIHTAKHSYVRAPGLRLHLDVDRIVSHKNIDWKLFIEKVKKTHVKTSTYFSLYIPSVLFGTKIPKWVLDELQPKNFNKIEKMLAFAGLLNPKERKFNKLQFLRFQTALYDSAEDMLKVINPGAETLKEIYQFKNSLLIPFYLICRVLDLVGIRKKK